MFTNKIYRNGSDTYGKNNITTNDYAFKRIFGKIGNENVTQNLLNSMLDEDIENVELDCNTILEKDIYDDKIGILDIKAKLNNKFLCNVEMQIINRKNIIILLE